MLREYQPYVTVPNSEGLNMDEKQLGVLASPLVAGLDCDDVRSFVNIEEVELYTPALQN